ncbi:hypothetical protein [Neisseria yangbaofengii]|nr:hypothetical protein [Neisseria yangbaofengii]
MIDRLMPIFAVIGILSSTVYLSLAVWVLYENLQKKPKKHVNVKQITAH